MMQRLTESSLVGLLAKLDLKSEIYRVNEEFEEFSPGNHDYGSVKITQGRIRFDNGQKGRFRRIGVVAKYSVKKKIDCLIFNIEIEKMFQFTEDPTKHAVVQWEVVHRFEF